MTRSAKHYSGAGYRAVSAISSTRRLAQDSGWFSPFWTLNTRTFLWALDRSIPLESNFTPASAVLLLLRYVVSNFRGEALTCHGYGWWKATEPQYTSSSSRNLLLHQRHSSFCTSVNHLDSFDVLFGNAEFIKSPRNNFMWNSFESLFKFWEDHMHNLVFLCELMNSIYCISSQHAC